MAVPAYANELPSPVMGTTSEVVVTLATTGNLDLLQADLGGIVISSEELQMKVREFVEPGKRGTSRSQGPRHPIGGNLCDSGSHDHQRQFHSS